LTPVIEEKKKGKVQTQYANIQSDKTDTIFDNELGKGWFYVPENVYIIGTMNDIDRSVESFDFAMRRRFTWIEITAEESAENMSLSSRCKNKMQSLNKAISDIDGLNSSYHIGGAYFLNFDKEKKLIDPDFEKLWTLKLRPLLKEYVRGMPEAEKKLKDLEKAYNFEKNTSAEEQGDENN
jgi:5-methylcytosine-specific restriction endonuclease McrBC GTP-binding regulatory subunit McrB